MENTKSWDVRIAEARERGEFTFEDAELAGDWTTCACGQRDPILRIVPLSATHEGSTPWDDTLEDLGLGFLDAVVANDFDDSKRILDLIQQRAIDLLDDIRLGKIDVEAERRAALSWTPTDERA